MNMSHSIKNLYIINGTMGIGKTTVSKALLKELDNCVFLDGDWCWMMDPFIVNDETKQIVMDNITHSINNFIHSSTYANIILCWVIPSQEILDDLIHYLDLENVHLYPITLMCTKEKLIERIQKDIDNNIRKKDVIERSIQYLNNYKSMNTIHIDVSNLSVKETIEQIKQRTLL